MLQIKENGYYAYYTVISIFPIFEDEDGNNMIALKASYNCYIYINIHSKKEELEEIERFKTFNDLYIKVAETIITHLKNSSIVNLKNLLNNILDKSISYTVFVQDIERK